MAPRRRRLASPSDSDSDYAPDEAALGADEEDLEVEDDTGELYELEAGTSGQRELGFSTAGSSGSDGDDDLDEGELFGADLDPMVLLEGMGQQQAGGDEATLQPFEVLRQRPWRDREPKSMLAATATNGRGSGDDASASSAGEDGGVDRTERGNWRIHGRATDRGRSHTSRRSRTASRDHEDYDRDIMDDIYNDPVAAKLGLAAPKPRRQRRSGGRGGGHGRGKAMRKKRNEMPEEVSKQLGLANLMYATKKYPEAIELLMQVVKACPNYPDPYHTLGLLHEATGNARKALDFYMIAAHLTPRDVLLWKRLAALSSELQFWRQAIYCFTKAIHRDKSDLDARWDRAVLFAQVGDVDRAMTQLEAVSRLRPGDPEVPKVLVRLYHRMEQPQKAIGVLERHMEQYPGSTDLTHVNMLAELLIQQGAFDETHQLLQRAAATLVEPPGAPLPLDLSVKAGMCLAHMGQLEAADEQLAALLAEGPEEFSDLFLDVGASFMAMGLYNRAVTYLSRLLEVPGLDDPQLWGRLLECHRQAGDLAAGVHLYTDKLREMSELDERYLSTSLTLCELYLEVGQRELGLKLLRRLGRQLDAGAVSQPSQEEPAGLALIMRKSGLHLALGQPEAFIASVTTLVEGSVSRLHADMAVMNNPDMPRDLLRAIQRRQTMLRKGRKGGGAAETDSVFRGVSRRERRCKRILEVDRAAAAFLSELSEGEATDSGGGNGGGGTVPATGLMGGVSRGLFSGPEHFRIVVVLAETMKAAGQEQQARELLTAVGSTLHIAKKWLPRGQRDTLRLLLAAAWLRLGDVRAASTLLKLLCAGWPYSLAVWAEYCRLLSITSGAGSWPAFVGGLRSKHQGSIPLMLMQGHAHAVNRNYAEALSEYHHALRFMPDEPLLLLCIAVAHISLAMTRHTADRNCDVITGFAYLQTYAVQRHNEQEAAYNTARALHELGLVHLAVPWYERALATDPPASVVTSGANSTTAAAMVATSTVLDLRPEAAHNLALIYIASGAKDLARQLYVKYRVK